jgi:hypothetical protein
MLVALPVTSFPYFPNAIGGEALVRPLSLYPLIFLFPFAILPRLVRKSLPKNLLALFLFVLVAVGASFLSLLRGIEPALGISVDARVLRGVFTLGIGCAFFLAIGLLPETVEDLRFSLRWIYAGISVAMVWGMFQAFYILSPSPEYFSFLEKVQNRLSTRRLRTDRISGMTYEPHWFAEQIILLLLPYALAAVINNYTVFRWRWRRLTMEWLLLAAAVGLLPFTFSRSGLMNLVVVFFLSILLFRPRNPSTMPVGRKRPHMLRRIAEVSLILMLVATPIYVIGTRNAFFARIWAYWKNSNTTLAGYLTYLGFDARLVYAQAAFNTYLAHPVLGVGLGNYAFYFEEMLPYRPIADVPEVLLMITPELGRDRLITAKNFFLRILAETGIMGGISFGVFLLVDLGYAIYLWLSPEKEWKYWGSASLCGLIAFALCALTFDSFVIPNMWVLLGLITAATRISTRAEQSQIKISERNYESKLEPA